MSGVRGTKRRLVLETDSPGPADTLTTDVTFRTAQERTLPPLSPSDDDDEDFTEVSSPARPKAVSKLKRQVEWLQEEATNFAKANDLSSTVQNATAGPSERELRAQHRQNRFQQPQPEQADAGMANAVGAADITDIDAAASLVDLMAHETLQGHESREPSQDTSSSTDRALAAAWSRVYGDHNAPLSSVRLAADWQAQGGLAQLAAAAAEAVRPAGSNQPDGHAMQSPTHELPDEKPMPQYPMPDADEAMHAEPDAPADTADQPDASVADRAQQAVMASPEQAVQPQQIDAVRRPAARQSPKRILASPQQRLPTPAGHALAQQQAKPSAATPASAQEAVNVSKVVSPVSPLAALVPSPGSQRKPAASRNAAPDLETRATQLAMQRLVAREAEQQRADAALLRTCAPQELIQIPLWADSLAPQQAGQLQGTLTIPAGCYVRLARRVFARAVQIQPHCVMLSMPHGGPVLQDFIAGQEASIQQYGLQASNAAQGLQVQLCLQQGAAQVQALIQQEAHLCKQELLAARLAPPAANATELAGQGRTLAGPAVTRVLQSAGWGTTSPAKRTPKAAASTPAPGQRLAEYEALLPAEHDDLAGAPVVSPGRRRLGRWSQAEVEMLLRKMEAGRKWAQMRDEWPGLGFANRTAVDLKDKWRNLEDVILKGKVMRTVQLSEDQKQRIHRCYRKYRFMTPASSSPDQSHSSLQQQQDALQKSADAMQPASPACQQQSSDSYRPTGEHDTGSSPAKWQDGDDATAHTPMTRSRARAYAAQQKQQESPSGDSDERRLK